MENPMGIQGDAPFKNVAWKPALVTDIIWNFEWFMIAPDGTPYARYHPRTEVFKPAILKDLKELLG